MTLTCLAVGVSSADSGYDDGSEFDRVTSSTMSRCVQICRRISVDEDQGSLCGLWSRSDACLRITLRCCLLMFILG